MEEQTDVLKVFDINELKIKKNAGNLGKSGIGIGWSFLK